MLKHFKVVSEPGSIQRFLRILLELLVHLGIKPKLLQDSVRRRTLLILSRLFHHAILPSSFPDEVNSSPIRAHAISCDAHKNILTRD
jgi:hypothetical protein